MKLTAKLALSQLKVNRRRTIWTFLGILLSTAMLTTIYNLGYGSGMNWVDRITYGNAMRLEYLAVVSGIAIVMSIFVICISVIVMSNAFRVSATERLAQFGILKSTGATKRQITQTVIYEGIFLTFIAIPLGIVVGLIFQWISIGVINNTIAPMLNVDRFGAEYLDDYLFRFILSPFGIVLSIGVSIFTVFLSAYLPARKAALVPAINAIRGTGEVKINNKKIRGGKVVKKVFKTEGMLARTFMKRNKKNFRATVIAISFSVAIFIVAGSLHTQFSSFANNQWETVDADLVYRLARPWQSEVDCDLFDEEELNGWYNWRIDLEGNRTRVCHREHTQAERMITTEDFLSAHELLDSTIQEGERIFGIGRAINDRQMVRIPRAYATRDLIAARTSNNNRIFDEQYLEMHLSLLIVDPLFHSEIARAAGVDEQSNILINHGREWDEDGRLRDMELLRNLPTELELYEWDDEWQNLIGVDNSIKFAGMLSSHNRPSVLNSGNGWSLTVIVPVELVVGVLDLEWYVQTDQPSERFVELQDVLFDYFADDSVDVFSTNLNAIGNETRDTLGLVLFFLSAFVAVLILIALTNVISTISENVKTRSKEFAVLQSVGMTNGGIKRMLSLESIFASINSLFVGVPLGVAGSYGVFIAMGNVGHFRFPFPWLWIVVSVIGVFLITWITMQFAASKLKEQNIIETIRNGSGM